MSHARYLRLADDVVEQARQHIVHVPRNLQMSGDAADEANPGLDNGPRHGEA